MYALFIKNLDFLFFSIRYYIDIPWTDVQHRYYDITQIKY